MLAWAGALKQPVVSSDRRKFTPEHRLNLERSCTQIIRWRFGAGFFEAA